MGNLVTKLFLYKIKLELDQINCYFKLDIQPKIPELPQNQNSINF